MRKPSRVQPADQLSSAPAEPPGFHTQADKCQQDLPLLGAARLAQPRAVLLVDGLFLHRPELREYWDFSIYLDVEFDISIPRGAARGPGYGSPEPTAPSNHRYIEGQRIYFQDAQPARRASIVIDNNNNNLHQLIIADRRHGIAPIRTAALAWHRPDGCIQFVYRS
jgi:hypothetical protein